MEISLQPYWCLWREELPTGKGCQRGRAHFGTVIKTSDVLPVKRSPANARQEAHTTLPDSGQEQNTCQVFFPMCYHLSVTDQVVSAGAGMSKPVWRTKGSLSTPGPNYSQDQGTSSLSQGEAKLRVIDLIQGQRITVDGGRAEVFLRTIMVPPMES